MQKLIGLIDVDGHNYPNIPLMKISSYHKSAGDTVEWYDYEKAKECFDLSGVNLYDKVYMSKVFSDSYTKDYENPVYADVVERGGTGYCITTVDGKEIYDKSKDHQLPDEIEHIYPDYDLYPEFTKDTAYGFLTRGCPRGCDFCHVVAKEGRCSQKVANLSEFWHGQKNIVLCDPNIIACKDWRELLQQLIDSKASVDINQGIDIRIMTPEKAEMLKQIKLKNVHFAWDRYEDIDFIVPKLREFKEVTGLPKQKVTVYILTNFDTTKEQDLERVHIVRDIGFRPFVMIYNKPSLPKGHYLWGLQRWANNPRAFNICDTLEDFIRLDKERRKKYLKNSG